MRRGIVTDSGARANVDGGERSLYGKQIAFHDTCQPVRLQFAKGKSDSYVPNLFRLLPAKDPNSPGEFYPTRAYFDETAPPALTGVVAKILAARVCGTVVAIAKPTSRVSNVDNAKWDSPIMRLCLAISTAKKEGVGQMSWISLMTRTQDRDDQLAFPKEMYIAYAAMYQRDKMVWEAPLGADPTLPPVVLDLGKETGQRVLELLDRKKPEFAKRIAERLVIEEEDADSIYEIPDPTNLDAGALFVSWSKESRDALELVRDYSSQVEIWESRLVQARPDKKATETSFGYHTAAVSQFPVASPSGGAWVTPALKIDKNALWRQQAPLLDHVRVATEAEQLELLGTLRYPNGGVPFDLFTYAFREYPQFMAGLPDSVKEEAVGHRSVAMPAAASPAGPASLPAGPPPSSSPVTRPAGPPPGAAPAAATPAKVATAPAMPPPPGYVAPATPPPAKVGRTVVPPPEWQGEHEDAPFDDDGAASADHFPFEEEEAPALVAPEPPPRRPEPGKLDPAAAALRLPGGPPVNTGEDALASLRAKAKSRKS